MNEPISFRSVTDLEEVAALDDGAYIVVIENGTAKRISKANANFGGGGVGVTKYILINQDSSTNTYTITHEDGSAVTPQEVYDAFMSGPVILEMQRSGMGEAETVVDIRYEGTPDNIMGLQITTSKNKTITLVVGE